MKPPIITLSTVCTGPRVEIAPNRETSPTFVPAVALLFAVFGSLWVADTLAVLAILPEVVVVTTTVTVALAPLAKLPRLQVNVPPDGAPQLPWPGVAELKVTLEGMVSVRLTPVAVFGPLLVMVTV
jgi:hypothetical protein